MYITLVDSYWLACTRNICIILTRRMAPNMSNEATGPSVQEVSSPGLRMEAPEGPGQQQGEAASPAPPCLPGKQQSGDKPGRAGLDI